jgi:DNA-directed RNA polymerase subunit omega
MMTKPGITELDRCVDSRYTLVSMVSKRARMIGKERTAPDEDGNEPVYNPKLEKAVTQAVEEIANGVVGYVRSSAIEPASEYREQKLEAISQFERNNADDAQNDTDGSELLSSDNSDEE